jgi:PAS domain S-box-containing protein
MNTKLTVLVVEDNPADVDLMRETLSETGSVTFHVESVQRLSEALTRLEAGGIDLALIDLGLPDSQGLGTFRKLRQAAPDLAMIVLTGNDDQETAVTAIRENAQDYLVKGQVGANLLVRATRYAIERKKAECRERLARDVLDLLNRPHGATETIGDILRLVKTSMDFEAVAIRLQEGDDFPYYVANGFPEVFLCAERYLCERNEAGEIVRDATGTPVLECMCGNILRGRTNPALPFFTEGGSFWTNNTTQLLATTTEADRQTRTRNRCNVEGYESVAIIPLRSGDEIIGLLQFNDHRPDRFTPETIHFFEGLGASIGIALARKRAEHNLVASEARYRRLFESAKDGIFILDAGTGRIVDVNPFLVDLLGFTPEYFLGKKLWEIGSFKDIATSEAAFLELQEKEYIRYDDLPLETKDGRRIDVEFVSNVYLVDSTKVIQCNVRDITERKRAQERINNQLEELQRWHDVMLGREDRVQELKCEVNEICRCMGETPRYPSQEAGPADAKTVEAKP